MKEFKWIAILVFCFWFTIFDAKAQEAVIEFEKLKHDFGKINEADGVVSYSFVFKNTGSLPLVINTVKASCGCTIPEWPKAPVLPGENSVIKAEYNPRNRPGVFDKTLTVMANIPGNSMQLKIHGIVIPKNKTVNHKFADTIGNLRLQSKYLDFSTITTKVPVVKEFRILNDGETPIVFSNPTQVPKHLRIIVEPSVLDPQKAGIIKVIYYPRLKNDYGNVSDIFTIPTNDKIKPKKVFTVFATIIEYFPDMTHEALENSPQIRFAETMKDFGELSKGSSTVMEFQFSNSGKSDLVIRKLKATCISDEVKNSEVNMKYVQDPKCLPGNASKTVIKAGETARIKVSLNSGKMGNLQKKVTVYCNDPGNPNPVLTLKAVVNDLRSKGD